MRSCPYCAEEVPARAETCPVCGMDIRSSAARQPAAGQPPKSSNTWIVLLIVLGVGGLLVIPCLIALLLPAVQQAREAARRTQCKNNLRQIALALHIYHDTYNTFPPAYIADENGRPMHSWRVLILPYLEQQPLYDRYDFSQPWDSPANQSVLNAMPAVFNCPSHAAPPFGTNTNYAGVFGPNCIFRGAVPVSLREITDGPSSTIMVGEVKTPIPWTSPQDVDIGANPGINAGDGFGSFHVRGAHFALADGAVRFLSEDIFGDTLQNLATINDGNAVGEF